MRIIRRKNKLIAKQGRRVMGYLLFSGPNDLSGKRNLVIDYLFVSPDFRRRGVGSELLKKLIGIYKGKKIWLSFWTGYLMERDKTWEIYKKLGFREMAVQDDYYEKGIATRFFAMRLK